MSSKAGVFGRASATEPGAAAMTSHHHYEEISLYHLGCKVALNAALSPIDNAKVLMQVRAGRRQASVL